MNLSPKLSICLWFDTEAEEAARYYAGIFPQTRIGRITRFPAAGQEIHGKAAGTVLTVELWINDTQFTLLNGGPNFKFNEAVSFEVHCQTQEEIDSYWEKLGAGGDPSAQVCGWLKDKYGVSWQIVPADAAEKLKDHEDPRTKRYMTAMLKMAKLDIAQLQAAYDGE